jgi:hypothetical protein
MSPAAAQHATSNSSSSAGNNGPSSASSSSSSASSSSNGVGVQSSTTSSSSGLANQKQLSALQAKLHYLNIMAQLPSYGAKCFPTNARVSVLLLFTRSLLTRNYCF